MNFVNHFKKNDNDRIDMTAEKEMTVYNGNGISYKLPCPIKIKTSYLYSNVSDESDIHWDEILNLIIDQLADFYGWEKSKDLVDFTDNSGFKVMFAMQYVGPYKMEDCNYVVPFNIDYTVFNDVMMSIAAKYNWEEVTETEISTENE